MANKLGRPPKPGIYVSTKERNGMRFVVEDVTDLEEDGYFLVSLIDEASAADMSACGDELDPDEWFALVERYGLQRADV